MFGTFGIGYCERNYLMKVLNNGFFIILNVQTVINIPLRECLCAEQFAT